MIITNLKVKTPSIPSRTAANQFLDREGYAMLFDREYKLFWVHDTHKKLLHGIFSTEVTNFTSGEDPAAFMALRLKEIAERDRKFLAASGADVVKAGPGRPRKTETVEQPV